MNMRLTVEGSPEDLMRVMEAVRGLKQTNCSPESKDAFRAAVANVEPVQMELELPKEATRDTSQGVDPSDGGLGETPAKLELPTVSKTDIRAKALELTKAGHDAYVKETFRMFGSEKLSGLKAEDYPKVLARLEEF